MGEIADALRRARELGTTGMGRGEAPRSERSVDTEPVRPADRPRPPAAADAPRRPASREAGIPRHRLDQLARAHPTLQISDGPALQACRQLAVRLRGELALRGARTVAVVSAVRGEGKTMVACNLAVALASLSQGGRVALLDLDLRSPSVGRVLGVSPAVGVEAYLSRGVPLEDVGVACETPPLDVYAAARPQDDAHELLVTPRFPELVSELRDRYSLVVVDTPPTLVVPDVSIVLSHLDACVPVARCGVTRVNSFRHLIDTLPDRKIVGEVLNEGQVAAYTAYTYGGSASRPDAGRGEAAAAPARRSAWRLRRRSS
jgi:Mrp family chromosome partitioning ATPase